MPVDHQRVEQVTRAVGDIYAEAEQALIALLTRQLQAGGFDDDTSVWAVRKLSEVRALQRSAQLLLDRLETGAPPLIRRAIADGLRIGADAAVVDLAELLVGDTGPAARAATGTGGAAVQALADAVIGETRPAYAAVLRGSVDAYRKAVAGATARRLAGARTTRQAAQDAWSALVAQGVTGFTDATGRRWRLSTYVEMATRTAVARAAVIAQTDATEAAGLAHVLVVDNPRECPMCRPWEAQVLSLGDRPARPARSTLAQAMAAGLFHPNCRHTVRPWKPGQPTRSAPSAEGAAGYDAEQQQRALERGLRRWRERYNAAFTEQAQQYAAQRIAAWSARLAEHLDEHPRLQRLSYRETPGAGFTAPKRARTRRDRANLAGR